MENRQKKKKKAISCGMGQGKSQNQSYCQSPAYVTNPINDRQERLKIVFKFK